MAFDYDGWLFLLPNPKGRGVVTVNNLSLVAGAKYLQDSDGWTVEII